MGATLGDRRSESWTGAVAHNLARCCRSLPKGAPKHVSQTPPQQQKQTMYYIQYEVEFSVHLYVSMAKDGKINKPRNTRRESIVSSGRPVWCLCNTGVMTGPSQISPTMVHTARAHPVLLAVHPSAAQKLVTFRNLLSHLHTSTYM